MIFKTKEELKQEIFSTNYPDQKKLGNNMGIDDAFKSFKERIDFYKKYKRAIYGSFQKDYPVLWKLWLKYLEEDGDRMWERHNEQLFSDWLFDYCFGDVIKNE